MDGLLLAAIRMIAPYRSIGATASIVFATCCQVEANTIAAKSVSLADVRSAIASARDGDTVTVPAGTATWTSSLNVDKHITLQGAGAGSTIIIDEVVGTGGPARKAPRQASVP